MIGIPVSTLLSWAFATLFAGAGLLHLAAPKWLRQTYQRWDYPSAFPLVAAALDTAAAVLLASPDLRGWGISLAEIIAFFSAIAILTHERTIFAMPAVVLMIALVPSALSIPHRDHVTYYAPEREMMVSSR